MRKSLATVVLSSLVVAVVAFSVFAASPQAADEVKPKPVQKWEYKMEYVGATDNMNKAGKDGWEAVGFYFDDRGDLIRVWLKRPITD